MGCKIGNQARLTAWQRVSSCRATASQINTGAAKAAVASGKLQNSRPAARLKSSAVVAASKARTRLISTTGAEHHAAKRCALWRIGDRR